MVEELRKVVEVAIIRRELGQQQEVLLAMIC